MREKGEELRQGNVGRRRGGERSGGGFGGEDGRREELSFSGIRAGNEAGVLFERSGGDGGVRERGGGRRGRGEERGS